MDYGEISSLLTLCGEEELRVGVSLISVRWRHGQRDSAIGELLFHLTHALLMV